MKKLLHPVKFDEQFEYEIKKGEQLYIVGIKKVKLNSNTKLSGKLYMDEILSRKKIKELKHILAQPIFPQKDSDRYWFYTEEKRKKIFSIKHVVIDEKFNDNIQSELIKQKGLKMNDKDIDYFFNGIYEHYN